LMLISWFSDCSDLCQKGDAICYLLSFSAS
jgi:hypothetical protein